MTNILKNTKVFFKNTRNFLKMNSHKHWNFIVRVSFFIIFILICFSLFLLYQIKNDQITDKNEIKKEPVVLIKEDDLEKIIKYFNEKNNKSEEIKNNIFPYSDPSL